jgi:ribonuclease Z
MRPTFVPHLVNGVFGDPALYVDCKFEKRGLLFDMGDLKALAPKKMLRVTDIFVSHMHMDHFMGFDWFLRTNLGRERTVRLFGPPGFLDQLVAKISAYTWNLVQNYATDFTLVATEIQPDWSTRGLRLRCRNAFRPEPKESAPVRDGILLNEPLFRVRAVFLDHKLPCLAFAVEEQAHVNVWKNRLIELDLPVGEWLRELKHAVMRGQPDEQPFRVWWKEGREIRERWLPLGELRTQILRTVRGQKLAYVTDTAYHEANSASIIELARDADLLFIETMFLDEDKEMAAAKYHLTARQAGELARRANAAHVEPFHFSPRYVDCPERLHAELAAALGSAGRVEAG